MRRIRLSMPVPLKGGRPDILLEAEALDELQEIDPGAVVNFTKNGNATLLLDVNRLLLNSTETPVLKRLLSQE